MDLHTHTRRSDGLLEPPALVAAAAGAGVKLLAITDHDTVAAYRELVSPGAASLPAGIELVPGIEINSVADEVPDLHEGELHILGLAIDPDDDAFEAQLKRQRDSRRARFDRTVERLRALGLPIDDRVASLTPGEADALGRPTLARLLVENRFAESVDDAFARILGRDRPAYVPRVGLGPRAAIEAIRSAGGLPVLAHFSEALVRRSLVQELQEYGLRGIEVYYRSFDPDTVARLRALADELRLVPTGGTDYHGDTETYAASHARLFVPDEVADRLARAIGAANRSARGPGSPYGTDEKQRSIRTPH